MNAVALDAGTQAQKLVSAPPAAATVETLVARLIEEMNAAWQSGHCLVVEDFLARYPELLERPETTVRLVYEELCLRQEAGEEVSTVAMLRRFPQWQPQLEVLFECYRLLDGAAGPTFPQVGELLGEFRLLAELGRGARGRVFLASQPSLGDRPLVLKITPGDGTEHLTLARLQHTHIVPLYFLQDFPAQRLQALCMPYLGGVTLAQLLQLLSPLPPRRRTGQHLVDALAQTSTALPTPALTPGPARKFLAQASYTEAVCWIGACLANALQYAHERGLVHLDLKPSNVLLTADGQPMLLDFHLAQEPTRPGGPAAEWLGGTPAYMSPEQQAAMRAVATGAPVTVVVDGRSDIYSLGVLLYEALGGSAPVQLDAPPARLNHCNPHVSPGLADIIHKCLARAPEDRYPDAEAVAADLRRHLTDRPLQGVRNRSVVERWCKWRRRRPQVLTGTALFVGVLSVLLVAMFAVETVTGMRDKQRSHEDDLLAHSALVEGREQRQQHQYDEAVRTLTRGLAQAQHLSGNHALTETLRAELRSAQRARAAQELHVLADHLRLLYDVDALAVPVLHRLEARCRCVWDARGQLMDSQGIELAPDLEQRLRTDLLELAILWTDLHVRLAPENATGPARQEALEVLQEAEALTGPSRLLYRARQTHAEALGQTEVAAEAARRATAAAPRTAWEHYALGRLLFRLGELEAAIRECQRASELQPQDFWPYFYEGICAYRLHRYEQAVQAFQVCVALAPTCAECLYNRGLAHMALGQTAQALRDYNQALLLNPLLVEATLNRGILHYQEKRFRDGATDFERALAAGGDPALLHYNLALVHLAQRDRPAAYKSLQLALQARPGYREARELEERLQHAP